MLIVFVFMPNFKCLKSDRKTEPLSWSDVNNELQTYRTPTTQKKKK